MPNKQVVTFEEVFEAKRVLARTLRDFRDFPCEATLTLLIIRLFETIQLVYELCFEERYDLYSEIIEFLDDFKMLDIDEDVSDDFEIQDTNDKSSSFEKTNTVNAFGDKKIK